MTFSTDKIIWLNHAQAVDIVTSTHGPRPTTNYSRPVACPWCGAVRKPGTSGTLRVWSRDRVCLPCLDAGHTERLMGQAEMRWRAEVWRAQGYERMAERLGEIADMIGMV